MTDQTATDTAVDNLSDAEGMAAFERELYGTGEETEQVEEAVADESAEDGKPAPEDSEAEAEDEEEGEDESESSPDEGAKPKRGIEKRFSELTSKIKELEAQLAAKSEPQTTKQPVSETQEAREPNPDDYDGGIFDPEYQRAVREWDANQLEARLEAKFKAKEAEAEAKAATKALDAAEKAFEADNSDYSKVKGKVLADETIASSEALAAVLMELPVSERPRFIHYLGKHLNEAREIAGLSTVQGIAKGMAIVEKLKAKPVQQVSKAPKPIKPLSGAGAAADSDYTNPNLSDARAMALMAKDLLPNHRRY